jgi:hypothetical protein
MNQEVIDIMREIGTDECIEAMEAELAAEAASELLILTPEGPDQEGDGYYVTVHDDENSGLLLGPYTTQDEAVANAPRALAFVVDNTVNGVYFTYGTVRVRGYGRKLCAGKLNKRIGLTV